MIHVKTFVVSDDGKPFGIDSPFAEREIKEQLEFFEQELGPHKTLNIIPEFPILDKNSGGMVPTRSFCYVGQIVALYCIATF